MDVIETGNGARRASTNLAARSTPFHEIPIIDFAPMFTGDISARRAVAAALRDAATNIGFFYIKNHGVPPEIIADLFAQGPAFFRLPLEEKMQVHVKLSTNNSGYTPLLEENTNPKAKGDVHEAYDMAAELADDDPDLLSGKSLYGKNLWPKSCPDFRAAMLAYNAEALKLGRKLFAAFALALDLPEDYFEPMITKPTMAQRIVYYPSQDGPVRPGRVRIKIYFPEALAGDIPFHCHLVDHEDNGMMAVLRVLPAHSPVPEQKAELPDPLHPPICRPLDPKGRAAGATTQ